MGLPLEVVFSGQGWTGREKALIIRFLRRSGSECFPQARYTLSMTRSGDGSVRWTAVDSRGGASARSGTVSTSGGAKWRSARLVQAILEELYAVH